MRFLPVGLAAAAVGVAILFRARRKKAQQPMARLRSGLEDSVAELEKHTRDLRKRARKLRGEAREFLEQQTNDLDERRKEVQTKLEVLSSDAVQLVQRARELRR